MKMPLSIRRIVGSWYNEENKPEQISLKESSHIKQAIEFIKGEPDKIKIRASHIVIGKSRTCHIILEGKHISDTHCEIQEHGIDVWYISDLGSHTGTYLQRGKGIIKLVKGEFKLEAADKIILGTPDQSKEPATYLEIGQW